MLDIYEVVDVELIHKRTSAVSGYYVDGKTINQSFWNKPTSLIGINTNMHFHFYIDS